MTKRLLTTLILAFAVATLPVIAGEAQLLRPGDVLDIKVYNHPELSSAVRIDSKGNLRMPLCGTVKAAGIATGELAENLSKTLENKQIEQAFVTVFVTEFAPRPVFVLGEVKAGGMELTIPPHGRLTALQALASAGGLLDSADKNAIGILRLQKDGTQKRINFNAASADRGKKPADVPLQPGDTIVVSKAKPVSVFGSVKQSGEFIIDVETAPTCAAMLSRAGGPNTDADLKRVLILRKNDKGETQSVDVDVAAVLKGDLKKDAPVQPGDVIVVNPKDRVYVLGEVKAAGAIAIERTLPMTLSKAIAQVGGTTRNASRGSILLFRGDKTISADLKAILKKDSDEKDILLQPGDVVYVPESLW